MLVSIIVISGIIGGGVSKVMWINDVSLIPSDDAAIVIIISDISCVLKKFRTILMVI